jgi:hypothetical protein
MRRPHGLATLIQADGRIVENDTISCQHCEQIVFVKPGTGTTVYLVVDAQQQWREEPGAFCRQCMAPICLQCYDAGGCTPFERELEKSEARDRLRRQVLEVWT